jgi:hypothetical protein
VSLRQPPPGVSDPDDDPTGIRDLLASLPDPGPMPDDLVSRITASLAEEQQRRPLGRPFHEVPRPHRPLWRTAGLAAAAAVVIGVGAGSLLNHSGPGELGALFGRTGTDSAASGAAAAREQSSAGAIPPRAEPSSAGDKALGATGGTVTIHHSARAYTTAAFASQAAAMLAAPGESAPQLSAESPAIGPIGTEVGLRSCLSALAADAYTAATADLGTFDGQPAAVVVLATPAGHTAYAVQRSCSTGHPALLMGPVTLP